MSEPIRILHVIGIMNRGGAETMIMNLYRNIDKTKVQFDFVENEGEEAAFDEEIQTLGGKIYRCPRYRGKNHFAYTKWWKDFFAKHKEEYPIVHGHIGSTAAIYLSIAKKHGIYTIAHSHSAGTGSGLYRIFAYPTRYIAHHYFACSSAAAVSRYGKKIGCDTNRCQVLNNAIELTRFTYNEATRTHTRRQLGIRSDALVLGHVGRFVPAKNHLFMLEVFAHIHQSNANSVLLMVGDGELRPQIEAAITEKNLENVVIMTGIQCNTWDYYQAMDIFAMPSLYEGLPVSLVEAQAAGLPCCVSTGVPQEAAITDLVQFRSLDDSPTIWADWIMEYANVPRKSMTEDISRAGYDISQTSLWLQNYYLEVVKNRGQ